ncbi:MULTISPECIES: hypothetical protein [Pseudomonas]|nr:MULTISPECIES: hypothetical protein [Pseudomonas]AIZ34745.1 hypothetical protein NJ69_17910 [Pseudomonas parafulva]MEE5136910.1 hypothetical protein [Pseudomonas alliivorans]OOV90305.1 hypothetical protein MF4836_30580 [Pseudomonas sp. MF4836]
MRLDQMPYHSMPTLAVLPFRQFRIGWTWQLRALKLFPDSQLSWKRYFYDNGSGHARVAVFASYEEAMEAADEFNSRTSELVVQAVPDPVLQSSTTLKVEKALTAARRIQGEEELMEREAIKRNAHLPRLSVQELKLHNTMESLRQPLYEELERAPYVDVVALPHFNTCLRRVDDQTWEQIGALSPKRSQICLREVTAKGFGLSGADHWGRTKAQIRALLLPRANQLLQLASVKQMLAEARMRGQRVLVCGGFVFWYEDDGVPRWVVKNTGGESNSDEGNTLWHEGTILSKNHGRIVVLPYIKENGEKVQGHTKNAPHDGKALPRHSEQYVTLPFEILDGDLMIGLFGELHYE